MLIVGGSGNNRGALLGAILVWAMWTLSGALLAGFVPPEHQARGAALQIVAIGVALAWSCFGGRRAFSASVRPSRASCRPRALRPVRMVRRLPATASNRPRREEGHAGVAAAHLLFDDADRFDRHGVGDPGERFLQRSSCESLIAG